MVDTTYTASEMILPDGATIKLRETGLTDYDIVGDILEGPIKFNRQQGDPKIFPAHTGKDKRLPNKAGSWVSQPFKLWFTAAQIKAWQLAFNDAVETGTGPYTYTYDMNGIPKNIDFSYFNAAFDDSGKSLEVQGTDGTFTVLDIGAEAEGKFELTCTMEFGAQNMDLIQISDVQLT